MKGSLRIALGAMLLVASPALAFEEERVEFCVQARDERVNLPPVKVGCGTVDCCPNCPLPDKLDWRIRVLGEGVSGLRLVAPGETRLERRGLRTRNGILASRLGPKGGVVRNLPLRAKNPMVLTPVVELAATRKGPVTVDIEQLLGSTVVNTTRSLIQAGPCPNRDQIRISGPHSDRTVVTLDTSDGQACLDDATVRAGNVRTFTTNLQPLAGCNSEVSVYSDGAAMTLLPEVSEWTPIAGDKLDVTLAEPVTASVTVWLTHEWAREEVEIFQWVTDIIFQINKTGIRFKWDVRDVSSDSPEHQELRSLIGSECVYNNNGGPYRTKAWVDNSINIYMTDLLSYGRGAQKCDVTTSGYIGPMESLESMAWIVASSFDLHNFHDDLYVTGMTEDNLFAAHIHDKFRWRLSLGQVFRMNINRFSALNRYNWRSGPTRDCGHIKSDALCPAINLDWERVP